MTEGEYKELRNRLDKYKCAENKISVIEEKKSCIQNGILSINCAYREQVDFNYLGDEFKERLVGCICDFLEVEIQNIKKEMEDI